MYQIALVQITLVHHRVYLEGIGKISFRWCLTNVLQELIQWQNSSLYQMEGGRTNALVLLLFLTCCTTLETNMSLFAARELHTDSRTVGEFSTAVVVRNNK